MIHPYSGEEFKPDDDVAELIGLTPQVTASELSVPLGEDRETDTRSPFERDSEDFRTMISEWQQAMEEQMVPTKEEIPDGYCLLTNHDFIPYEPFFVRDLELINRGADYLVCRQAFTTTSEILLEDHIAIYTNGAPLHSYTDRDLPEFVLSYDISQAHINQLRLFGTLPYFMERETNAMNWAKQHGIAVSAFMTSLLIDQFNLGLIMRDNPDYDDRTDSTKLEVYNTLASEVDDDGNRKFLPLSIEQFAGLSLRPLYLDFGRDPGLNEKFGLTKTFPAIDDEPEL
ncbi:MAG TPA: hypothetical protein VMR34_02805 [Candidatus Saccharimonadales bacterium]|nr:hypothetical protein [Candidatus Saccharimonadales bacterium]